MILLLLALLLTSSARAADGAPDLAFGSGGKVLTAITTSAGATTGAAYRRVVIGPDGKIIAAGNIVVAGMHRIVVVRYNADGSVDPGFGRVLVDFPGRTQELLGALALLPGGDVVVAASADDVIGLARLRPNGQPDPFFGDGGTVVQGRVPTFTGVFGGQRATGLVVSGARLLVSGYGTAFGNTYLLTSAWDLEGHPIDRGPSLPGNVDFTVIDPAFDPHAADAAPYRDGTLIAVSGPGLGLVAADANGFAKAIEGPFANDLAADSPRWLARIAGGSGVVANAVAADPNGDRWAVAGSAVIGGVRQLVVARFSAAGVDRGFSGDGVATFNLPGSAEGVYVLPDRRILVAGVSGSALVLLRLLPNGELDRTFGGDGVVIGDADAAYAVAADAAGKVVAVGRDDQQLLVVRYGPALLPCTRALGCVVVTPRLMTVEVPRALTMSVSVTRADGKRMLSERVVVRRAGPHRIAWRLPPGRYRVRMRAGGRVSTFTMRVGRPSTPR